MSRQHLTDLREEAQPHPRAYSFSGHGRVPVRIAPPRAFSHSSDRGGRRRSDLSGISCREPTYHRADSAPSRSHHELSLDDVASSRHSEMMHESWPRTAIRQYDESVERGHESWPRATMRPHDESSESWQQHYHGMDRAMYDPHSNIQSHPPRFHPIASDGVAAFDSYREADQVMMEVESVGSTHVAGRHGHWAQDDMDFETTHSRRGSIAGFLDSEHADAYSNHNQHQAQTSQVAAHQRNDSTVSATVIVAQLSSALSDTLHDDDNPFEPIPIGDTQQE